MDKALKELVEHSLQQPQWLPPGRDGLALLASAGGSDRDADMVAHDGVLALDELPALGISVITHLVTLEKLSLPGVGWDLHYDEDGFAVAVPTAGEAIVVEDRLQFGLFKAPDGDMLIAGTAPGFEGQVVNLREFGQRWRSARLDLPVGATRASRRFELAIFRWPRAPAARVAMSARSLYDQIGLDQFGGQQWRWVDGSWRRWRAIMQQLGLGEQIVPSGLMKDPFVIVSLGRLSPRLVRPIPVNARGLPRSWHPMQALFLDHRVCVHRNVILLSWA